MLQTAAALIREKLLRQRGESLYKQSQPQPIPNAMTMAPNTGPGLGPGTLGTTGGGGGVTGMMSSFTAPSSPTAVKKTYNQIMMSNSVYSPAITLSPPKENGEMAAALERAGSWNLGQNPESIRQFILQDYPYNTIDLAHISRARLAGLGANLLYTAAQSTSLNHLDRAAMLGQAQQPQPQSQPQPQRLMPDMARSRSPSPCMERYQQVRLAGFGCLRADGLG